MLFRSVAAVAVVLVAQTTSWWALLGLGFIVVAAQGVRTVLDRANLGPRLIPALQQTGLATLVWGLLVGVPLLFV